MNLKQLAILLFLVAFVGGAGLIVYRNQNASWKGGNQDIGKRLLGDFPVNDVAQITIAQGTNQLNLVKKDDLWRVQERHDYPANYAQIRDFLLKVQGLKVVQSERVNPAQLAALQLAPPGQGTNAGWAVDFKGQSGKPIRTLLLGKTHTKKSSGQANFGQDDLGWPDGRYVRAGDSETVSVISDPLENIEPRPAAWLSKDFIRVEKPKSIAVESPQPTNSWKLTRETESAEWKLADAKPGEQLDSAKTGSLSYSLGSPAFVDVLPGATPMGAATNPPTIVRLETFDHFNYVLRVGAKTGDTYPVTVAVTADIPRERVAGKDEKPADQARLEKEFKEQVQKLVDKLKQERACENWTYLVSSWTIDPLLKERAQLFADKKAEGGSNGTEPGGTHPEESGESPDDTNAVPAEGSGTN